MHGAWNCCSYSVLISVAVSSMGSGRCFLFNILNRYIKTTSIELVLPSSRRNRHSCNLKLVNIRDGFRRFKRFIPSTAIQSYTHPSGRHQHECEFFISIPKGTPPEVTSILSRP